VQILNDTVIDILAKNMSLQANLKVSDDMLKMMDEKINEFTEKQNQSEVQQEYLYQQRKLELEEEYRKKNDEITQSNLELKNKLSTYDPNKENLLRSEVEALKNSVKMYENNVTVLTKEKEEWDKSKHQLEHLETFRKELIKSQNEVAQKEKEILNIIKTTDEKLAIKTAEIDKLKNEISKLTAVEVPIVVENVIPSKKKKGKSEAILADGGKF
jgi:DNA repair exonuclease SbcCD ATPase subunit